MNDEQFQQIIKGMFVHTELLDSINNEIVMVCKATRTIASIMGLSIILGLLLGFCSFMGL